MIIMRVDHENISNTNQEEFLHYNICVFLTRFPNFYNYQECVKNVGSFEIVGVKFPGSSKVHFIDFISAVEECVSLNISIFDAWPIISDL